MKIITQTAPQPPPVLCAKKEKQQTSGTSDGASIAHTCTRIFMREWKSTRQMHICVNACDGADVFAHSHIPYSQRISLMRNHKYHQLKMFWPLLGCDECIFHSTSTASSGSRSLALKAILWNCRAHDKNKQTFFAACVRTRREKQIWNSFLYSIGAFSKVFVYYDYDDGDDNDVTFTIMSHK